MARKAFPTFGAGPPLLTLRVDVPWQLQRERNAVVLGTWEENAFQVSLRDRAVIEDPLHIPLFSDVLPYHCIPHIGVYSPDDYSIALPLALLSLPTPDLATPTGLLSALPADLQQVLWETPPLGPSHTEAIIIIHSRPQLENSLNPEVREVNLIFHTWAFQGLDPSSPPDSDQAPHITLEMDVFGGEGVCETEHNICEELNGVPVGRLGPRILYMHSMSFSPHNAQLSLLANCPIHSFFSFARHAERGMVLAFHIVPSAEEVESRLRRTVKEARTVKDFILNFELLITEISCLKNTLSTLHKLITSE